MKRLLLLLAAVLLAAAASVLYPLLRPPAPKELLEVVQDGKIIRTIDLAAWHAPEDRDIPYEGHTNRLHIERGHVYMASADCPDQVCVETGVLRPGGPPIVCLPHKLIIRYQDNAVDGQVR